MRKGDRCVLTQILKRKLKLRLSSRFKIVQSTRGGEYEKTQKRLPDSDFLSIFLRKMSHAEKVVFYATQPIMQICLSNEQMLCQFQHWLDDSKVNYCLANPDTDPDKLCDRLANVVITDLYHKLSERTKNLPNEESA